VLRTFIASATTTAVLATGCTAERPWPATPVTITTRAFATQGAIATIDVLPLDLELWAEPGYNVDLAALHADTTTRILSAAVDALDQHHYTVAALIDSNGDFPGGNALARTDLRATLDVLGHYGAATARHPGQLPVPALPVRLGAATGADATLYVGGWAYVAPHHETTGEQIVGGLVVAVMIITVIAIVASLVADHGGHGGGHGHGSSGGHGGNAGHAARVSTSGGLSTGGARHFHHGPSAAAIVGRTAVDIAMISGDGGEAPEPPASSEPQMYLEMTLVDNHTGLALWHAHQTFPASAESAGDTARVTRSMLALLPVRASLPRTAAR